MFKVAQPDPRHLQALRALTHAMACHRMGRLAEAEQLFGRVLGKLLCLLQVFASDFRWQIGREDTPSYPTARLCRQRRGGDWAEPIAGARQAIAAKVAAR